VYVLGLKVLVPVLMFAVAVYSERRAAHDQKERTKLLITVYAIVAVSGVVGLVYDHMDQAARTAAAE
jgi:ABC-type transport system involved in cytochrome c biogenesis permease component